MQANQTEEYVCEVLISSATLLAKDLVVDGSQIRKSLLKVQLEHNNQGLFENGSTSIDDDLELLVMRKYLKNRQKLMANSSLPNKCCKSSISDANTNKHKRIRNSIISPEVTGVIVNTEYFYMLQQCDDLTFQNQFKLTKKTFEVCICIYIRKSHAEYKIISKYNF